MFVAELLQYLEMLDFRWFAHTLLPGEEGQQLSTPTSNLFTSPPISMTEQEAMSPIHRLNLQYIPGSTATGIALPLSSTASQREWTEIIVVGNVLLQLGTIRGG